MQFDIGVQFEKKKKNKIDLLEFAPCLELHQIILHDFTLVTMV